MLKKLFPFVLIIALIFLFTAVVFASSEAVKTHDHVEEDTTEHVEEGHAEEEHHGVPVAYYVQWFFIFAILGMAFQYAVKFQKHGQSGKEGSFVAYAIVGMVFLVFFLGYTMMDYHEPLLLGFLRLFLLFIGGALVTFYGVLGRHDEVHH
ncbi:hypothetical protein [Candidatus Oleimmundimicrobium sp.]|uniref:hypothetical protein n=1 Tax=Candidatus Oleimmundimicrobium sp. TaxID=3060597 RepID=UPI00271C34FA|nr:hypothetical protein [Candidatus Oleimmundimicrobium sp.]MDO8885889.1 hypothetical protein [Candidatus Oleimmundimicrobium sp.]